MPEEPAEEPAEESTAQPAEQPTEQSTGSTASGTPLLPRRTPGANDMPGKPMESDGTSGGWFTRKDT